MAPVARERNFARAKKTERVEFPQRALAPVLVKRKQAATELDLPAGRSRPEPTEPLTEQELVLLLLENPRMLVQARRTVEPLEQVEHWPATLLESTPARWKPRKLLARAKNNLRPPRSLRAWAALGTADPFVRQAFPAGGMSLPASKRLEKRKPVASKQD